MKIIVKNGSLTFQSKQVIVNPTPAQIGYTENAQYVGNSLTPSAQSGKTALNVIDVSNLTTTDTVYIATAFDARPNACVFKFYDANNTRLPDGTQVSGKYAWYVPEGAVKMTVHADTANILAEGIHVFNGVRI